jgi:glutathione synthase
VSPVITTTGLATLVLAPFGGYASTWRPSRRPSAWGAKPTKTRPAAGGPVRRRACSTSLVGLAGGAVVGLLAAFPRELVLAVAGLALLGTIGGGLAAAHEGRAPRDAAALTFLVTLSGVTSIAGIGSAFWGVVAGTMALALCNSGALAQARADPDARMPMKLLFVADPLESFKTYKDSTFAMMREAARRGHTSPGLRAAPTCTGSGVARSWRKCAKSRSPATPTTGLPWQHQGPLALRDAGAVLMRKDPPFDPEYFYATHLLSQAEREGARVFNKPGALRDHPEKLAILEFPQFIGPTLVTRDEADVKRFHAEHHDIILKPLDGMGGMGIFRVGADGMNLGSIVETLNRGGAQTLMVQKYLPEIVLGDKRVLVIGGEPVPFCLARIPQGTEIRGNLAAGGKGVAQPLSERDREIAHALGPVLAARGLLLVGLDIIGSSLTEINVTSPTCFAEITQQTGFDVAKMFHVDALELALERAPS